MKASNPKAHDTVRRHTRLRRAVKIVGPWRVGVSLVFGAVATVLVAWWIAVPSTKLPSFPRTILGGVRQYFAVADLTDPDSDVVEVNCWEICLGRSSNWGCLIDADTRESWKRSEVSSSRSSVISIDDRPGWMVGVDGAEAAIGSQYERCSIEEAAYGFPFLCLAERWYYGYEDFNAFAEWLQSSDVMMGFPHPKDRSGLVEIPDWISTRLGLRNPQGWSGSPSVNVPAEILPIGFILNTACYGAVVHICFSMAGYTKAFRRYRRVRKGRCASCDYRLEGLKADACPECGWAIKNKKDD